MSTAQARFSLSIRGVVAVVAALVVGLCSLSLAQTDAQSLLALRQAAQSEPENVQAWLDLGQGYHQARRYGEAKEAFLEAIALDYRAGDAHFGLGLAEYARGDFEAALFAFSELTRLYPERFDGHFNRAVTLARLRRAAEAVEAFREALRQAEPEATAEDLVNAHVGLAGQLKRLSRYTEAADAYRAALDLRPADQELRYLYAEALYRAGKGLDALPGLIELEAASSDYRVSALIADIYVEAGQIDYALRSLERALRRAEASAENAAQANVLIKLGLLQRNLGRESEAMTSFDRAARADPGSWQALYHLGVSHLELGRLPQAQRALEDALALSGDSGELHLALASTYDQLGRSAQALEHADLARSRLSDSRLQLEAEFIIGRSLYYAGDYQGAKVHFERVLSALPDNATAQLWAGLAEYSLGDYRRAAQYYERAVQLDPNSVEARINLGAAYLAAQRFDDARLIYELLVQQRPNDAELHFNLGWALFAQGNREGARSAWQQALELGYAPAQGPLGDYF